MDSKKVDQGGKFLITLFESGRSFGTSWEGDFHESDVPPDLDLLVTFVVSLEVVHQELCTQFC
jgi:hypothetical protein